MSKRPLQVQTRLVHEARDPDDCFGYVNPPVIRGSTVLHDNVAEQRGRYARQAAGHDKPPLSYGIYGSPTHHAFYDALSALEGGHQSWALPSGLTACAIAIQAYVNAGDHVLIPDSAYWPTGRFVEETLSRYGVTSDRYPPCITTDIEQFLRPNTRVLVLESPGSHTFEVQDVPLLADIARRHGITTVCDNTWATPLYFQPLKAGVDVSVHAATKYIGGHSDLLMGTVTATADAWPPLRRIIHHYGLTTSADDCWIALRGLRTLAARLQAHRAHADALVAWLRQRPEVERVLYPPLADDPGHALWRRDFSGASGLFGVALKPHFTLADRDRLIDSLELFGLGASWGGFESLVMPTQVTRRVAPPPASGPMFRLHAGLEAPADLIADLERAFDQFQTRA